MADDTAPVAEIIVERDYNHGMFLDRWKWMIFINPPKLRRQQRSFVYCWADYHGSAATQKRALKKAMKLVPRYVRTQIR